MQHHGDDARYGMVSDKGLGSDRDVFEDALIHILLSWTLPGQPNQSQQSAKENPHSWPII
jgi:hypothetical protein